MSRRALAIAAVIAGFVPASCPADDWLFDAAPYTNDPKTGQRVEQYAQPKEPDRVPYDKFFSEEHPYIPYWYYYDEMGWPGQPGYIDVPYGGSTPITPSFGPIGF